MAIVSTPLLIASLVATAAAGAASVVQTRKSSKKQQEELMRRRRDEAVEAQQQELQRREKINRVLAAQAAAGSAANIAFEGTPTVIATKDVARSDLSDLGAQATLSGRQKALTSGIRTARQLGNLQAATTILSTAGKIGQSGVFTSGGG